MACLNVVVEVHQLADELVDVRAGFVINQDIAPDERLQRVNALEKQLSIVARQYKKVTETLDIQE